MWNWFKSLASTYGLCRAEVPLENEIDGEFLCVAIERGHFKIVKTLLKNGADVNASCDRLRGSTFLHLAVINGHYDIAKILIEHGADVNMRHKRFKATPIYCAIRNLDENMTKLLLSGATDLEDTLYLLSLAFQLECTQIIEIILQHNPKLDINATYGDGRTVLFNIVQLPLLKKPTNYGSKFIDCVNNNDYRKAKLVEFCLRKGAIVDGKTIDGRTALYAAVVRGFAKVVEKLLEYGAEVDAIDDLRGNMTPLMIAARANRFSVVQSLIKFLPNSEIRDMHGKTALHYAVRNGSRLIIQELLYYGADINATSRYDTTPYTCDMQTHADRVILEWHIHKMKALDLHESSKNLKRFNLREDFYNDCKWEIEEMKHTKISDSVVTFYDVLTKRVQKLAMYVKNENILKALSTLNDYVKVFPIYSVMMHHRFVKSIKLESLLTSSEQSLVSLIGFELPYVVTTELLDYLRIEDLKKLIKACPYR